MPATPLTFLRRLRRPIAAVAVWLLLWQALAGSLAVARTAALAAGGIVICHSGGGDPAGGSPAGDDSQDCCAWCMAAAAPALPPAVPWIARAHVGGTTTVRPMHEPLLAKPRRLVRAGDSQPPPSWA